MFQITDKTTAIITGLNTRTENHGDEKVPAISLHLKITGPNTILDLMQPGLRHALYTAPEGQEQLEGMDVTPLLRTTALERIKLKMPELKGWRLCVEYGIADDDEGLIDLHDCTVKKFHLEPFQGGSCELTFMVSTSDVDATYLGRLGMKIGQEAQIQLLAPEPKPEAIDGSVEAFEADHPDAGDLFAAAQEEIAGVEG